MTYNEFIQNIIDTRGQWNIPEGEYWEGHHIIPECLGGEGDPRKKHKNIIRLYADEHYEAHKLLAIENKNNSKLIYAWLAMSRWKSKDNKRYFKISKEDYKLLKEFDSKLKRERMLGDNNPRRRFVWCTSEETKEKISKSNKGKRKGWHWYNNGITDALLEHCPDGWSRGRIRGCGWSNDLYKTGKHWYTNGIINVQRYECPENFWKGQTRVKKL